MGDTEQCCLLLMANIAVSNDNRKELLKSCVDTIIGFSKKVVIYNVVIFPCLRWVIMLCLIHVAKKGGCVKPMVSFAFLGEDANARFQAVATLRHVVFLLL